MSENTLFLFYDFLQYLVNGLSQGSIYALIALGYTMVYGILKLINFAHGEFYMIGSFTGYFLIRSGMPIYFALPLAMLIPGLVAVVVELVAYRPIRHAGKIPALITALGVSFFFQFFGQGICWSSFSYRHTTYHHGLHDFFNVFSLVVCKIHQNWKGHARP
jgi:branched-chain amino acid transport system permease protein